MMALSHLLGVIEKLWRGEILSSNMSARTLASGSEGALGKLAMNHIWFLPVNRSQEKKLCATIMPG
jgi:hypothetical protein